MWRYGCRYIEEVDTLKDAEFFAEYMDEAFVEYILDEQDVIVNDYKKHVIGVWENRQGEKYIFK